MATAIYLRVSTAKQEEHGVSLETQKEKLSAYCIMKDFKDVKEYIDVGSGRTTENRINFNNMMKDVESGYIKNIVILRLDRLTRSIIDLNKLILFLNEHNCHLHSSTENIDTTTPSGRLMINLIGTFAQWESETISERVKVTMQHKSEQGYWLSSTPHGYDLVEGKLIINDEEAHDFQVACDLILKEGYSFLGAYKYMRDNHNVHWSSDYLTQKIESETTIGNTERNGKITYNTHEPLISVEKRNKLLEIKRLRTPARSRVENNDLFRRKIKCFICNSILSLNFSKRKSGNMYYTYQCSDCFKQNRGSVVVSESTLEKSLIKYMDNFEMNDFSDTEVKKESDEEVKRNKLIIDLSKLKDKRDRIQRAWINGMMEDADLEKYKREIDLAEQKNTEELSNLGVDDRIYVGDLRAISIEFNKSYKSLTRNEKARFIQTHIKEIHFKREKKKLKSKLTRYNTTFTNVIFT